MSKKRYVSIFLFLSLFLCGCSGGSLFSKHEEFSGKDSLVLETPRPDILDIVAEVGKSMGYSVSVLDRESNTITLSSRPTSGATGKYSQVILTAVSKEGGKKLDMNVRLEGNSGAGGQDEATKLVEDFKKKLLETIRQHAMAEEKSVSQPPSDIQAAKRETSTAPPKPVYLVVQKTAKIREEANTKCRIVATVKKGDQLEKISESGNWYKVKLASGQTGWVYKTLVKDRN